MLKIVGFLAGLLLLLAAGSTFLVAGIGTFEEGRTDTLLMGLLCTSAALPLLAAPFSARIAKVLLAAFLVLFAGVTLVFAFDPPAALVAPWRYQVAAVVLAALVLVRLGLAWRARRATG